VGTLATVSGGPPVVSTLLSVLPTMKPTCRLSGDQKRGEAPSVPADAAIQRIGSRTHNPPGRPRAPVRPSGDTDTYPYEVTFSGTGASNRLGEHGAVG
jgi:hypothetical protein